VLVTTIGEAKVSGSATRASRLVAFSILGNFGSFRSAVGISAFQQVVADRCSGHGPAPTSVGIPVRPLRRPRNSPVAATKSDPAGARCRSCRARHRRLSALVPTGAASRRARPSGHVWSPPEGLCRKCERAANAYAAIEANGGPPSGCCQGAHVTLRRKVG
jgi:hypothetical protein